MNHIEFALLIQEERDFIRNEMEGQDLTPHQLAGLANVGVSTVVGFTSGSTFSPHHRTIVSMIDALGYESVRLPKGAVITTRKPRGRRKQAVR